MKPNRPEMTEKNSRGGFFDVVGIWPSTIPKYMKSRKLKRRLFLKALVSLIAITAAFVVGPEAPSLASRSSASCVYGWLTNQSPSFVEYSWQDITSTGQQITPTDVLTEDSLFLTDIGFDVSLYDSSVSQVEVSSDGFVSFSPGFENSANVALPSEDFPSPAIAAFWDDLQVRPERGGGIFVQTIGDYPRREFVIEFYKLNHWDNLIGEVTFEVVLFEGSNNILLQYQDTVFGGYASDDGGGATVGIQGHIMNAAGELGLVASQISFDQPVISDGLAILFDPDYVTPDISIPKADKPGFNPGAGETVSLSASVSDTRCTPATAFELVDATRNAVRRIDAGAGSGLSTALWDGKNDAGEPVPPGSYSVVAYASDGLATSSRDSLENLLPTDRFVTVLGTTLPTQEQIDNVTSTAVEEPQQFRGEYRFLSGSGVFAGDDSKVSVTGPGLPSGQMAKTCAPPSGAWLTSASEAQWISVDPACAGTRAAGEYVYSTTFELPEIFSDVLLTLESIADDDLTVLVNGTEISSHSGITETAYAEASDQALFKAGTNTMTFKVKNLAGATGLWFEGSVLYTVGLGLPQLPEPPASPV